MDPEHNSKEAWSSETNEKDTAPNHELVSASETIRADEDSKVINENETPDENVEHMHEVKKNNL